MSATASASTYARRLTKGVDWRLVGVLVLALASLVEAPLYADDDPTSAVVVNLVAILPLALWRPNRLWVPALMVGALLVSLADVEPVTVAAVVAVLCGLYLLASSRRRLLWAWFAVPFVLTAVVPVGHDRRTFPDLVVHTLVAGAFVLGDAHRQQRQAVAERDASRQAVQASLHEQAVMEERARIARELHDVVAHNLSVIAVQADTARLATEGMPEEGRGRVEAIGATARDALTEMRRLLGVLRTTTEPGGERAPQPGLDGLADLVDTAREAGTPVRLTVRGTVQPVPPGVDVSAYRILQEALTNARRHAPGAQVDVDVHYDDDRLHLQVCDDGPGPDAGPGCAPGSASASADEDREGHGLLGMRERAALVGGELHVGPGGTGGFVVEADLPIAGPPS
jgi:signal transduction histidine kinase